MTSIELSPSRVAQPQVAAMRLIGTASVAVGVFLSGFVIAEPAPYELWLAFLIGTWFILGLRISRSVGPLLALFITFNIGGMLSITQMRDLAAGNHLDGPIYIAVSTFLALSSVFYAAIVEDNQKRLRLIFNTWVVAALITASLGILGYFHAVPGFDIFTRYDRAMGAFQDPNVFGPYLVTPSLYLMHGLLVGDLKKAPVKAVCLLVLAFGVFLSFSRAAWALFAFASVMLIFCMLLKHRSNTFRLRILVMSMTAIIFMVVLLVVALQFPQVSDLFTTRLQLVQSYDGGHLGRFERHGIGFMMSMERPLGLGPLVFGQMFREDEHNTWLKTLTTYGWIGFACWISMICWTIYIGFRNFLKERPWQPYVMIAWIVILGHVGIGNVIDTDHWRHLYMLIGIVWGCGALEQRYQRSLSGRGAAP
ncbi:O-antigen ligase family protein [Rhizobium sp. P38BS-XIX]|uniref:O-antigen ligase family protein n=1 Tax=Rhizobium sp. P38BS-XIX TaxID=2726740 RepID=UPI001456C227|nr:O-antigen ligase family protein [Rhizobium sp. P38BS-XIX]NLR95655.1 O-antigen ligase family protein [Rhizobium sp. P38BS-XIX]